VTQLLVIASCVIFFSCLVHPLKEEFDHLEQRIILLTSQLAKKESVALQLDSSRALSRNVQRHLEKLTANFTNDPFRLLQSLQRLAEANHVEISWSTPQPKEDLALENIALKTLTIQLSGKYEDLRSYLTRIAHIDSVFGIKSFEMLASGDHDSTLRTRIVLQIPTSEGTSDEKVTKP
jgi:Tfp pilus assembly protein PilO